MPFQLSNCSLTFPSGRDSQEKFSLGLLNSPQRERLPCFKTGILMINKFKPTVVVRSEVRLIFSETEFLECAWIILAAYLNDHQILIPYTVHVHDFCGNCSQLASPSRRQSRPTASPLSHTFFDQLPLLMHMPEAWRMSIDQFDDCHTRLATDGDFSPGYSF